MHIALGPRGTRPVQGLDHLTELHGTRQEAVGRLMGRFATREDEVDNVFRLGVFVDLYRVAERAIQLRRRV